MNILITSCGRRSYMIEYFKNALKSVGGGEVIAVNSTAETPCVNVANVFYKSPLIYSEEYIPFLLGICKKHNVSALISLFDIDLPVLAKNRDKFEEIGIKMVLSSAEVIEICNDKFKMFTFLCNNNIYCPESFIDTIQCEKALDSKQVEFPLIIKPRRGMGSVSMYTAEDKEELFLLAKKCKKDIEKSYLKYEAYAVKDHPVLIQKMVQGREYGLDIINDPDGKNVAVFVKEKLAMRAGETDVAVLVEDEELETLGRKLAALLKHVGCLDVDIIKASDGRCYVIDMNARFGGGYPFSHLAGANVPLAIINWLSGKTADESLFCVKYGQKAMKDITISTIKECD